ncbi:serine hydrolase domain-containing protein [Streptomyces sp. NPDC020875]|uniref:serine hydrolase domain-containing protein n=1 Tax=Streptomyces sp. NPDC020875 TaxID=3154898 RepID=UPI0033F0EDC4
MTVTRTGAAGTTAVRRRRAARTGAAALIAGAVAMGTLAAAPARAGERDDREGGHSATQRAIEAMVAGGVPGVTVTATDANGVWKSAAGVGDLRTGKKRGENDRFRVASITKTFVATVLLQLEDEGRLDLDDTVEKWLPGLVRGNGHDGRKITVRQLLNHTSGVYDYTEDPDFQQKYFFEGFLKHRYDTVPPEYHIAVAMAHPPNFKPGAEHRYSNTGYVLAGLIIEKVTGTTYEHQVRKRIINPLKLRATTNPGNTFHLPQPSSRMYSKLSPDPNATTIHDTTVMNGSQGWADGDIISSAADLNRFYRALMRGELLSPKQLAAMKTTTAEGYGLGLYKTSTSCGKTLWGHGGGAMGSLSDAVTTEDGRHQLAFNANGDYDVTPAAFTRVVNAEFCGDTSGTPAKSAGETGADAPYGSRNR